MNLKFITQVGRKKLVLDIYVGRIIMIEIERNLLVANSGTYQFLRLCDWFDGRNI